ncbi:unnamed protein product [Rotaria sordida]|uniref:Magnesium transporter MRS2 homolog, mitochondrial n=1 Tax=Rotaria sordida TaxID=392033 RepID=A0A815VRD4_9BILA|nr:unnamed protein product [Rotaria sordida]CAF1535511.1 unnamed protein product [Rotaria sordida]
MNLNHRFPHFLSNSSHILNCDIFTLTKDSYLQVHRGSFGRTQICQQYNLEPRDLQKLDTNILINVPLIDIRQNRFICFSFQRLQSLVQFNRSIFFVPSAYKAIGESFGIRDAAHWERISEAYRQNVKYIYQLYHERFIIQASNNIDTIPYEFRITEINLETVAHQLKLETHELLNGFQNVRERAYARIILGRLRELAHKPIIAVLAHDEDMIGMYLTDNRKRDIFDHTQAELLLEASTKQTAEVRRSISDSVHTLESATGFMLDAVRNELLAFEI